MSSGFFPTWPPERTVLGRAAGRRLTTGKRAGQRRYRRAFVQVGQQEREDVPHGLHRALRGRVRLGGEVYFVAGDRMQASRAFGGIRKIAEADPELRGLRSKAARHEASHAAVGIVCQDDRIWITVIFYG
jgi:hypothetical protein